MPNHLKTKFSLPLEREYESWIIQGIEEYLSFLKVKYEVWAVSPQDETVWPADQTLFINSKLIGLQLKQAKMAAGAISTNRLKWSLHQPPGQFELIQKHKEIFYCLPTFINRDLRHKALEHCVFWRPKSEINYNVWFDNPSAKTPYKCEKFSMRWGAFYESIISCESGIYLESIEQASAHINGLRSDYNEFIVNTEQAVYSETHLYIFIIEMGR